MRCQPSDMPAGLSVGIIGAGVSGLSAAWHLIHQGHSVRVFEADFLPGGKVRSERHEGFLAELGPSSMTGPSAVAGSLVEDLNLKDRRLWMNRSSAARYVIRRGRPVPIPSDPFSLLATRLFSPGAKLQLLLEPLRPRRTGGDEESIAGLVRRRLGQEFVDYALDPISGGIFAGDPECLSAEHALPRLGSLERRYGSLLRGGVAALRDRVSTKGESQPFSFRDGLAELPLAIAAFLGPRLRLNTRVTGIHRLGQRWILETVARDSSERSEFDAVICTVPAHILPELGFTGAGPEAFTALGEIHYAPVAVVAQGFRRDCVSHPLAGYGVLVPRAEKLQSLGTLFSSSLFEGRAPSGHVLLTSFVGGMRNPGLVNAPEPEIADVVRAELVGLLGVRGDPVFTRVHRWRQAIPQYEVGYPKFNSIVDEIELANPGFLLAGNYRHGVSIGDAMTSGYEAASMVKQNGRGTPRETAWLR